MTDEHSKFPVQFCVEVDNEYSTNTACIIFHVFNILDMVTVYCFEIISNKCKIVRILLAKIMKGVYL
jgi:hypothetical protein